MTPLLITLIISLPLWLIFVFWYQRYRLNKKKKYKGMGADWPNEWLGGKGTQEILREDSTSQDYGSPLPQPSKGESKEN
ncbi:hypothetical protein [Corynebacterium lowii]|uniref:Uncharacterized protein n=1 Tax=Corynebacterium lowii TaxID=1544413 RepID=A0A0Q1E0Y0_9CORY|nr:hypothetical protein [Corynebacterium lowii]KQB86123.1 hypothetical protein Clow_01476 [Corynebacterium lowii]MDP9852596.1 hypothetical protein [Corynebacterium lowii]